MKRTTGILTALLLFAALLPACQPTPAEDAVIPKDEQALQSAIEATAAPAATPDGTGAQATPAGPAEPLLGERLGAPARWSEPPVTQQVPSDTLTVTVDAEVIVPKTARAPVYTARLLGTDADARQAYVDALFGGQPLYEYQHGLLKSDCLAIIEELQQTIDSLDPADYAQDSTAYEDDVRSLEQRVEHYLTAYADAPEDYTLEPWTGDLADADALLMAAVPDSAEPAYQYLMFSSGGLLYFRTGASETNMLQTREPAAPETEAARAAQAAVQALLDRLGLDQFHPDTYIPGFHIPEHTLWVQHPERYERGFQFAMTPEYAGFPVHEWSTHRGSDSAVQSQPDEAQYAAPLPSVRLTAIVDGGTVSRLNYESPLIITGTENEDAVLLPFSEVQERFYEQIFRNYHLDAGQPLELRITRVELSLMRVQRADRPGEFYLLPVWDFLGYHLTPGDDPNTHGTAAYYAAHPEELESHLQWSEGLSFLTLNALDGSVIDRDLGY